MWGWSTWIERLQKVLGDEEPTDEQDEFRGTYLWVLQSMKYHGRPDFIHTWHATSRYIGK